MISEYLASPQAHQPHQNVSFCCWHRLRIGPGESLLRLSGQGNDLFQLRRMS
jgi:hypothetical protein